jgi:hypothetical protein
MADKTLLDGLTEVRRRLAQPALGRDPVWPALAAAAFFTASALVFAAAAILAPPVQSQVPPAILRGQS